MAKATARFVCQSCAATTTKWSGRCETCGEWNTITEEKPLSQGPSGKTLGKSRGRAVALTDLSAKESPPPRTACGMDEFDRVLGAGWCPPARC